VIGKGENIYCTTLAANHLAIILTLAANHIAHRFFSTGLFFTWRMNPGVFNFLEVLLTSLYGNANHYNCVRSAALEDMKNEVVNVVERKKKRSGSKDNEMDTSNLMRFISKILGLNLKIVDLKWHTRSITYDGSAIGDPRVIKLERKAANGEWICTSSSGHVHVTEFYCWCGDSDPIAVLLRVLFGDATHAKCVFTRAGEMLLADESQSKRQKSCVNFFSVLKYVASLLDICLVVYCKRGSIPTYGEVKGAAPVNLRLNRANGRWTCDTEGQFVWRCPICEEGGAQSMEFQED
jgi:hypothetical protein